MKKLENAYFFGFTYGYYYCRLFVVPEMEE